jgi:cytochrome c1
MKSILLLILASVCVLPALADNHAKKPVDADEVYKNNCMRCHSAVRQYSPRMTATIVNHMRVRANLTAEETQAILRYLTENAPPKTSTAANHGGR